MRVQIHVNILSVHGCGMTACAVMVICYCDFCYRVVSSVSAIAIHRQHDDDISNTQWSEGPRADDSALPPSVTSVNPSFFNRGAHLNDQHSVEDGSFTTVVSNSADAVLSLHSPTAASVTTGGQSAQQSAPQEDVTLAKNPVTDPNQCQQMSLVTYETGQRSPISPVDQDYALRSLIIPMNPRSQFRVHSSQISSEILLASAVQHRANQVMVVTEVPIAFDFASHDHAELQILWPPCAEGESVSMSDASLPWHGAKFHHLQERCINDRTCVLGLTHSPFHVPAPWDVHLLQHCVAQAATADPQWSCGMSQSSCSAIGSVFGSESKEALKKEDLMEKHQDRIYYSALDGLPSSTMRELHAFVEVLDPDLFTTQNVCSALDTGMTGDKAIRCFSNADILRLCCECVQVYTCMWIHGFLLQEFDG